ncbi:hypothetical protein HED55_18225 [Ochrobactrum haematophilum]|uniref:Uncharacterized protein n=2 Tax=Brucella haematophila TaxID=419474 RepID=A0ABX1DPN5_9HYPH|nr:hypothetical protein [Brucella haematophila]
MAKQDITFANCDSTWQKRVMTAVLAAADTRPAPAATDTGLVTYEPYIETACSSDDYYETARMKRSSAGKYVTRSQAEELLAAKDRLISDQAEQLQSASLVIDDLQTDNAAKGARVKAETELREDHQQRNKELEAKLAVAEKALEPFSKFAGAVFERNFNNTDVIFEISASDGGVLELKGKDFFEARAALGGKPS